VRRLPWVCDRALLPYRLARARARQTFIEERDAGAPLIVDAFRCDFPEGEAAYNGLGRGHDGTIYFAVSTKSITPGRLFAFDPRTGAVDLVTDLDSAFPSSGVRAIPHGKVHVDLSPADNRLYGATHVGYYERGGTRERPAAAPGYAPYPGGWIFALEGRHVRRCAQAPAGEGIIAMTVDAARGRAVALTWPAGRLLAADLASGRITDHGAAMGAGESGSPTDGAWQRVCRSIAVHPESGHAFWSDERGVIWRFAGGATEPCARLPVADIWRKVSWHAERRVFVGWTWRDALLFTFDPAAADCRALTTLAAPGGGGRPATLGFALSADAARVHALARGPGLIRDGRIQLAESVSHLTFDLGSGTIISSGPLRTRDGRHVTQAQSLLLVDGHAYAVAWVEVPATERSAYAAALRARRRDDPASRAQGYVEEIALIRFPAGGDRGPCAS